MLLQDPNDVWGHIALSESDDIGGDPIVRGESLGDVCGETSLTAFESRQLRRSNPNVGGRAAQRTTLLATEFAQQVRG